MTLNKAAYLAVLHKEAALFAEVARQHTEPPIPAVPSCPEWNLTDIVLHLGGTHRFISKRIREGWIEYLRAPEKTNSLMVKLNPAMVADTMKEAADVQKSYIVSGEGSTRELGKMAAERWTTLSNQLFDLKLIKKKPQAKQLFQNF